MSMGFQVFLQNLVFLMSPLFQLLHISYSSKLHLSCAVKALVYHLFCIVPYVGKVGFSVLELSRPDMFVRQLRICACDRLSFRLWILVIYLYIYIYIHIYIYVSIYFYIYHSLENFCCKNFFVDQSIHRNLLNELFL